MKGSQTTAVPVEWVSKHSYPYYSCYDEPWGEQLYADTIEKIKKRGAVLCCAAMILAAKEAKLDSQLVTPSSLNSWLLKMDGYSEYNDFQWHSLRKFGLEFRGFFTGKDNIQRAIVAGKYVILRVVNLYAAFHFVLATGYNSKGFTVMDPSYTETTHYDFLLVQNAGVYEDFIPSQYS